MGANNSGMYKYGMLLDSRASVGWTVKQRPGERTNSRKCDAASSVLFPATQ